MSAQLEGSEQAALRLSPQYVTAAINLADLYRQLGRDDEGENILRTAIAASPRQATAHHALGLVLTRLKQPDAVLANFAGQPNWTRPRRTISMSMRSRCIPAANASRA